MPAIKHLLTCPHCGCQKQITWPNPELEQRPAPDGRTCPLCKTGKLRTTHVQFDDDNLIAPRLAKLPPAYAAQHRAQLDRVTPGWDRNRGRQ